MRLRSIKINREDVWLALVATVAGIAIGGAACLLKWLIKLISEAVMYCFNPDGNNLWLVLMPVIGIVIVGFLVRKVIKLPMSDVTAIMQNDISSDKGRMPLRLVFAPIVTCALTLGFGGSGGAESPIAYSGAAIGSNVARLMRVRPERLSAFIGLGAGAGIAAIFQSPIGGFFYLVEVIRMKMDVRQTLMAGAMCLTAYLTAYAIHGFNLLLSLDDAISFRWEMMPWLLLLGLGIGVYSFYYQTSGKMVRAGIRSLRRPLARNVVSGLAMGAMLCLFPALYGEGYGVLTDVVHGLFGSVAHVGVLHLFKGSKLLIWSMAGILALKGMAVFASNSGGGVVGTFTPSLFAGGLFGALMIYLFPAIPVPEDVMVLCGMGAALAGIKQCPVMAIFVVVELTGMSQLFLPVTLTVLVAFAVANFLMRFHPCASR